MTHFLLDGLALLPFNGMVFPKAIPLREPLEEAHIAVRPLRDGDAALGEIVEDFGHAPSPLAHRELHFDARYIRVVAALALLLVGAKPDIADDALVALSFFEKPRRIGFYLEHPSAKPLAEIRDTALLSDETEQGAADNGRNRPAQQRSELLPVVEHLGQLAPRRGANIDVFARLHFRKAQGHRGAVLPARECDDVDFFHDLSVAGALYVVKG